ncbi:MAG TPA: hypothetical protein VM821_03740 [Abditibacteriaceae bacterium]|jgi:hypothetical protein|nr:hypothetical protein [Abditibacteriaceae bacterium]
MSNLSISEQQKLDLAHEELKVVEKKLREMRNILNRDWETMPPRDRSAQSRIVKELEQQRQSLLETIEASGAF